MCSEFGDAKLIELCADEKALGRKTLVYSVCTGTRDTTAKLKALLEARGFKVGVLRATVDALKREDWVADQVERGIDVMITNPELVKTGLDLLDFPTIVFMQSGFNVYTVQQAARRSWRIGEARGEGHLPWLRRHQPDRLSQADGQEDHSVSVHIRRYARKWSGCVERQ